jgi:hypothetical protein
MGAGAVENRDYAERNSMTLAELIHGLLNSQEASHLGAEEIFAMEVKLSDAAPVEGMDIAKGPYDFYSIYLYDNFDLDVPFSPGR